MATRERMRTASKADPLPPPALISPSIAAPSLDHARILQELLPLLRGKRSAAQVSARLGYKSNQVYRWESGQRHLPWTEFVRLARHYRVPIDAVFRQDAGYAGDLEDVRNWMRHLLGQRPIQEIAAHTGYTPKVIGNWLRGTTRPDAVDIFCLLDRGAGILLEILEQWVNLERLTTITEPTRALSRMKRVYWRRPGCGMVLAVLEAMPAKPRRDALVKQVARYSCLSREEIRATIQEMIETGSIAEDEQGLCTNVLGLDTRGSLEGYVAIRRYGLREIACVLDKLKAVPERSTFAHFMFSASPASVQRIRELFYRFTAEVKQEVMHDSPTGDHSPVLLDFQLVDFEEFAAENRPVDDQ